MILNLTISSPALLSNHILTWFMKLISGTYLIVHNTIICISTFIFYSYTFSSSSLCFISSPSLSSASPSSLSFYIPSLFLLYLLFFLLFIFILFFSSFFFFSLFILFYFFCKISSFVKKHSSSWTKLHSHLASIRSEWVWIEFVIILDFFRLSPIILWRTASYVIFKLIQFYFKAMSIHWICIPGESIKSSFLTEMIC